MSSPAIQLVSFPPPLSSKMKQKLYDQLKLKNVHNDNFPQSLSKYCKKKNEIVTGQKMNDRRKILVDYCIAKILKLD